VRVPKTGELRLDGEYDPDVLRHVWTLKVSDEEAEVLGDLQALPVREIVATHGSRGSTVYTDGRVEEVPATWNDRAKGESRFRLFSWMPHYLRWYFWALARRLRRRPAR